VVVGASTCEKKKVARGRLSFIGTHDADQSPLFKARFQPKLVFVILSVMVILA
jgi:hypothetical protein